MKRRKLKKGIALLLCFAFLLSLTACGNEKKELSGKRLGSIFDFFNDPVEPSTEPTTGSTEAHTGDQIVDPPVIDPPVTDPNQYADTENEELNKIFDEYFAEYVSESIITYRDYVKDGSNFGVQPPVVNDWGSAGTTAETLEEDKKHQQEWIDRLEAIDVNTLTEQQRFDYDYLLESLKSSMVAYENINLGSAFSPLRGIQSEAPTIFTDFIFREEGDVHIYLDLMDTFPAYVDECLKTEQEHVDAGYGLEDCVIDEIIKQCDDFLTYQGEHFLVTTFNDSMDELDFLTDTAREGYKTQNREAVKNSIIPAYQKIKESFTGWKGKNKIKGGLCNYEDHGSEIYEYVLREYSGSSMTPKEMKAYLEKKEQELTKEMQSLYMTDPQGYQYYVKNEKTLFDYLNDKSATEIVDYLMQNAMDEFPDIGEIKYQALNLDKSLEDIRESTLAYYSLPPIDDPDGNLIRVNGKHKDDMWVTLAHEGCPGHMYQTCYYRKTNPNKIRLLGLNLGYMEGWAVYSSYESLKKCDFNGSQYASTLAELTKLEQSLGYLYHGIIDIGINYEGWTLDDLKSYLRSKGLNESAADQLYYIFVGDPGVYLSYAESYFEIQDLRDYAETELGSKFNVVDFHKAVLDAGPCKFDQLKKCVDKYILETK